MGLEWLVTVTTFSCSVTAQSATGKLGPVLTCTKPNHALFPFLYLPFAPVSTDKHIELSYTRQMPELYENRMSNTSLTAFPAISSLTRRDPLWSHADLVHATDLDRVFIC